MLRSSVYKCVTSAWECVGVGRVGSSASSASEMHRAAKTSSARHHRDGAYLGIRTLPVPANKSGS